MLLGCSGEEVSASSTRNEGVLVAKRVVIAEDEAIVRLDLREILEEEGFEVVGEAARGRGGRARTRASS